MSGDKTKRELTTGDKHATPDVLAWMPPLALSRPWTFGIVLPRSSRHIPVVSAVDGLEATKTPQASFDGIPAAAGEARAQTAMAEAPGQKAEGVAADQRPSPRPATRGRQAGPVTAPMRGPPAARPLAGKQTAGRQADRPPAASRTHLRLAKIPSFSRRAHRPSRHAKRGPGRSLPGRWLAFLFWPLPPTPERGRTRRAHAPWLALPALRRALPAPGRLTGPAPAVRSAGRPPGACSAGTA